MLLADMSYKRACRKRVFFRGLLRTLVRHTGNRWCGCPFHALQAVITLALYSFGSDLSSSVYMRCIIYDL